MHPLETHQNRSKITRTALNFPVLLLLVLIQSCMNSLETKTDPTEELGDGTIENPFRISQYDDLLMMKDEVFLDKHFIQVNDIDASKSKEFGGFIPIGTLEAPFTGSYDGNGYQITDLAYNDFGKFMGLFGYVKQVEIQNVTMVSTLHDQTQEMGMVYSNLNDQPPSDPFIPDIDSENFRTGGTLVGFNDGGVIHNCQSFSRIASRRHFLGGLVGYNAGEVSYSFANGDVAGLNYNGGLVGINSGLIQHSHATGDLVSLGMVGGLTGYNFGGQIINSFAKGNVGSASTNGGLAAVNTGLIQASYATGNTNTSVGKSGSLVGRNDGEIRDSYSLGSVSRAEPIYGAGSLAGVNLVNGVIINSFAVGHVSSRIQTDEYKMGGITGKNKGTITSSYWDTQSTGQATGVGEGNPEGATGLTTQQMSGPAAEINMPEFDWHTIWRTTAGYPVLRWQEDE